MPADRRVVSRLTRADVPLADGLLLAPIDERGPWSALQALRLAMRDLKVRGLAPRLAFVYALSRGGRIVSGRDSEAAVFVLGFRLPRDAATPPARPGPRVIAR